MRDIAVMIILAACIVAAFKRPWLGVLGLALFTYANPHRYAWGFATQFPRLPDPFSCRRGGVRGFRYEEAATAEGLAHPNFLHPLVLLFPDDTRFGCRPTQHGRS